jgi:hypothetical protein
MPGFSLHVSQPSLAQCRESLVAALFSWPSCRLVELLCLHRAAASDFFFLPYQSTGIPSPTRQNIPQRRRLARTLLLELWRELWPVCLVDGNKHALGRIICPPSTTDYWHGPIGISAWMLDEPPTAALSLSTPPLSSLTAPLNRTRACSTRSFARVGPSRRCALPQRWPSAVRGTGHAGGEYTSRRSCGLLANAALLTVSMNAGSRRVS